LGCYTFFVRMYNSKQFGAIDFRGYINNSLKALSTCHAKIKRAKTVIIIFLVELWKNYGRKNY